MFYCLSSYKISEKSNNQTLKQNKNIGFESKKAHSILGFWA